MVEVIDFEGVDGSGKTTALKYFVEALKASGKRVLETREVGSPLIPSMVKLREFVLDPKSDLDGKTMELIFAAMRIENMRYYQKVNKEYDYIVSDRGWLSHLAYTDHNVNADFTEKFYYDFVAHITFRPDWVVYLDVSTETALKRRVKRGTGMDVIEMKGVEFQEKVRNSFEFHLARLEDSKNARIVRVDANKTVEEVQKQLGSLVKELA